MFIDANEIENNAILETDVCIVGAGPAGIIAALYLAQAEIDVLLIESGRFNPEENTDKLHEIKSVGVPYVNLNISRSRYFGGTSNIWTGVNMPLDPHDFNVRPWIPQSGWPIQIGDLTQYYNQAHALMEIGARDFSADGWRDRIKANNQKFLIPRSEIIETRMWQQQPIRFGLRYRDMIRNSKNIRCVLGMNATELIVDDRQNTADKIKSLALNSLDKKSAKVVARSFVLAQGGMETPRLMLLSDRIRPSGVGNRHDNVGRYFMDHINLYAGDLYVWADVMTKIFFEQIEFRELTDAQITGYPQHPLGLSIPKDWRLWVFPGFVVKPAVQAANQLSNAMIHLRPLNYAAKQDSKFLSEKTIEKLVRNPIQSAKSGRFMPIKRFLAICNSEQTPNRNSRVKLSKERDALGQRKLVVDWRFNDADWTSIDKTMIKFGQTIAQHNVGRLRIRDRETLEIGNGHHHSGTTRMSTDPRYGVVDKNLRVHNTQNLYIASSAVFPTIGAANPTMTILALTLRLTKHLKKTLRV